MIDSCYLDTTVLVEALLKSRRRRTKARAAVQAYAKSLLPVYAIKEMSAGALSNFVWLYNRLAESRSLAKTYQAIASNIRRPNRTTTSLEALQAANEAVTGLDLADARTPMQTDRLQAEMLALSLRRIIQNAWRDRRKITSAVVEELECFPDEGPFFDEERRMLVMGRTKCPDRVDCSYAGELRKRSSDLESLLAVIKGSSRAEDNRRRAALHTLKNTPRRKFENENCRNLGDAYFALHCPENSTILTSNTRDHGPLAEALGRTVTEYKWDPDSNG
jgi:hypothetical protein